MLNFRDLREVNVTRCNRWHGDINNWSLSDWAIAMIGEAGEICNVVKKLNRARQNLTGNSKTEEELKKDLRYEIADTLTYLDLLAAKEGIDLEDCVREKFNIVSEKHNFPERL